MTHVQKLNLAYKDAQDMRDDLLMWKHKSINAECLYGQMVRLCDDLHDALNKAIEASSATHGEGR